jgi:hypothetical protein
MVSIRYHANAKRYKLWLRAYDSNCEAQKASPLHPSERVHANVTQKGKNEAELNTTRAEQQRGEGAWLLDVRIPVYYTATLPSYAMDGQSMPRD